MFEGLNKQGKIQYWGQPLCTALEQQKVKSALSWKGTIVKAKGRLELFKLLHLVSQGADTILRQLSGEKQGQDRSFATFLPQTFNTVCLTPSSIHSTTTNLQQTTPCLIPTTLQMGSTLSLQLCSTVCSSCFSVCIPQSQSLLNLFPAISQRHEMLLRDQT